MDDSEPQSRVDYFRAVAATLRAIADQQQYNIRRADQLRALAAGFERFAERLELVHRL